MTSRRICIVAGLTAAAVIGPAAVPAQRVATSDKIHLNQIGFYPVGPKLAIVADSEATSFVVLVASNGDTAFRGALSAPRRWSPSNEIVRQADFTGLRRPGHYLLAVPGVGHSYPFAIQAGVMREVARATAKAFYFQRASTVLPPAYAGRWARPAGHPDTSVIVHPSAASPGRSAGTRISAPRGWYDAGDYNKYVVNSGISTYTLLALAEDFPEYVRALDLHLPESGGAIPDVVHEALWNLRWVLAMQDPSDGGVYHKLTNGEFDKFIAPHLAVTPRFVVQKSTAATLDFAALTAHAVRIARRYPWELPGLADSLMRAATAAWSWARQHPDSPYDQTRLNAHFAPPINTGAYGDRDVHDEFQWAAAELYLATAQDSFLVIAAPLAAPPANVPSWNSVRTLGLFSLITRRRQLPAPFDTVALGRRLLTLARELAARTDTSAYGVSMAGSRDFVWGSNAIAANQGVVLVHAFRLTGDSVFLRAAVATLDYILGRNATGYSFVTGYGAKTPMAPHHRLSASDTVVAPIPGLLVGGPNPGRQDHCAGYPSPLPALSYVDDLCSYASNEVAINWNAPLAYLAAAVDAIFTGSPDINSRHPSARDGSAAHRDRTGASGRRK